MQTAQQSIERSGGAVPSEYLTFTLASESYGIDILKVQEIRGYDAVTRIANTPEFIKGVINLRGVIVPIVDLRIKFKVGEVSYHEFTVVIIKKVINLVIRIVHKFMVFGVYCLVVYFFINKQPRAGTPFLPVPRFVRSTATVSPLACRTWVLSI